MNQNNDLKIKVCGLTQMQQIRELIDLNIDFLGFIFYEKSPRFVLNHLNLKNIAEIPHFRKVGVFVNESIKVIVETVTEAQLDIVQMHGNEDEIFIQRLKQALGENIKIIKVFRIENQMPAIESWNLDEIDYFLFDTDSKAFGGTGQTFNWSILNQIEIPKPYFLSGGISLENFNQMFLIKNKPFAIDINSKFEIQPGIKDLEKIKLFKSKISNYEL